MVSTAGGVGAVTLTLYTYIRFVVSFVIMWLKKLSAPESNETREIDAVQTWEVRWRSRHGEFSSDTQPEIEVFPSEMDAQAFAKSLANAFDLIRTTSGNRVEVRKRK